jgi:hypothetical protein
MLERKKKKVKKTIFNQCLINQKFKINFIQIHFEKIAKKISWQQRNEQVHNMNTPIYQNLDGKGPSLLAKSK